MNTKAVLSGLLSNALPLLFLFTAYWKRKETAFWAAITIGLLFSVIDVFWGIVLNRFVSESDVFREGYGPWLSSFYRDWYFIYFHSLVVLSFILLVLWRRNIVNKTPDSF